MAIQYVNTGSGPNANDGDNIRSAFYKVNKNFDEIAALIGSTATNYTELVGDEVAKMFVHNSHTGVSAVYDETLDILELTVDVAGLEGPTGPAGPSGPAGEISTATGGASVTVDVTPPTEPEVGDLWYDTITGKMYVYYDNSWIDSSPSSFGPASDIVVDRGVINGNITFNRNLGSVHVCTITGDTTILNIDNMFNGRNITFIITQDEVGGHTVTWPANVKFAGGSSFISSSPNAIDMVNMFQAGSTVFAVVTTGYL